MPSAMPPPNTSNTTDKSKTHKLGLKGSSKIVVEFFDYACNTILFQRGVYPPEDFTT
ncbi:Mitotic spindle checkpoint component mad2, partial [Friedmanniomyces endolithicus]